MNEKAKELGATDTNFVNPSGLFAEGQLSTANDLLKITAYAFSLPAFEKISTIEYYEVPPSNLRAQITKINHSNVGYRRLQSRCILSLLFYKFYINRCCIL